MEIKKITYLNNLYQKRTKFKLNFWVLTDISKIEFKFIAIKGLSRIPVISFIEEKLKNDKN